MGDGPHHIDLERDRREAAAARISNHRDRLLAFVRLVKETLDRANPTLGRPSGGISYTDEDTLRREIQGLI